MMNYGSPRSRRKTSQALMSTMRGGKLMPVMAVPFRPQESGVIHQEINIEMEPIAGRLISDTLVDVYSVYVPALAVDAAINPDPATAGNTEAFRQRLLDGDSIFPMEPESEVTMRMGIEPVKIGGALVTNAIARVAHNLAVNYLRKRMWWKASAIPMSNSGVTPALLSSTILDRFNAVLSPEDRINGAVTLEGEIPVKGLGIAVQTNGTNAAIAGGTANIRLRNADGTYYEGPGWIGDPAAHGSSTGLAQIALEKDPSTPNKQANLRADFSLAEGTSLSLKQFYLAEAQDRLVRQMAEVLRARPSDGPALVTRMVHGMTVDPGKQPFIVYENTVAMGAGVRTATDGASLDVEITNTGARIAFSRLIPSNEFGGIVITFAAVKPEEVVAGQPHPVLSEPWKVINFAADDMIIDPEPVMRRQLDSDVPQANETDVMFWVGHNHFDRNYLQVDWTRDTDVETVDHKSARWRFEVPIGVSPENIVYPAEIDHYPFMLNSPTDPAASVAVKSVAEIASPRKLGPTPIEEMEFIDDEDLLET